MAAAAAALRCLSKGAHTRAPGRGSRLGARCCCDLLSSWPICRLARRSTHPHTPWTCPGRLTVSIYSWPARLYTLCTAQTHNARNHESLNRARTPALLLLLLDAVSPVSHPANLAQTKASSCPCLSVVRASPRRSCRPHPSFLVARLPLLKLERVARIDSSSGSDVTLIDKVDRL